MIMEDGQIVCIPASTPREGWEKSFKQMHEDGDDTLLIEDIFEDEAFEDWK
jgi:antitoxin MazE